MNKTETESKIEYLEASDELLAKGLRPIKRRHLTKPGEVSLKDCQVKTELSIDADLYKFLEAEAEKIENSTVEKLLNKILRERFDKEEAKKLSEIKELRTKLLNDTEFLQELKEKLAA
ncbi:hypothetical protein BH20ACI4_BH20ACI4_08700 [soil metagenome]